MPDDQQPPTTPERDRRLVVLCCVWIAIGLVGNVVLLVVGQSAKLTGGFMMAALGVLVLLCYAAYRRSRRRASE